VPRCEAKPKALRYMATLNIFMSQGVNTKTFMKLPDRATNARPYCLPNDGPCACMYFANQHVASAYLGC
jgi:hypothetical protein